MASLHSRLWIFAFSHFEFQLFDQKMHRTLGKEPPKFLWTNFDAKASEATQIHRSAVSHNLPSKAVAALVMNPAVEASAKAKTTDEQNEAIRQHFSESPIQTLAAISSENRFKAELAEPRQRKDEYRTRMPRQPASAQPTKRERIRPSLSDQLASIASNSSALIDNMKECIVPNGGGCAERAVLLLNLKQTVFGKCESRYSSPIQFFGTRCHYTFHHPVEKRVEMEMNYKDMSSPTLDESRRTFSFRVNRQLGMS
jgi:hypothetical protein